MFMILFNMVMWYSYNIYIYYIYMYYINHICFICLILIIINFIIILIMIMIIIDNILYDKKYILHKLHKFYIVNMYKYNYYIIYINR